MNILIAEDTKETREVLKNIIHFSIDNSIKIYEAENGVEALDILKKEQIDILLTDIMMPLMNGFELITKLKEDKDLKKIFIAAITGLSQEEEIKKIFACGADYYISKPIQRDDIVARLKLIHRLVYGEERQPLKMVGDIYNPFEVSVMKNYYTIFKILQEEDLFQIIHYLTALYPKMDKIKLKDFITFLLKSYESLEKRFDNTFEIKLETTYYNIFLSMSENSYIQAIKKNEESIPDTYEIKYMLKSMTIKIPIKGGSCENPDC